MLESSRLNFVPGVLSQPPRSTILKASPIEMAVRTEKAVRIAMVAVVGAKRRNSCILTVTNICVTKSFSGFQKSTGFKNQWTLARAAQ